MTFEIGNNEYEFTKIDLRGVNARGFSEIQDMLFNLSVRTIKGVVIPLIVNKGYETISFMVEMFQSSKVAQYHEEEVYIELDYRMNQINFYMVESLYESYPVDLYIKVLIAYYRVGLELMEEVGPYTKINIDQYVSALTLAKSTYPGEWEWVTHNVMNLPRIFKVD